MDAFAKKTEHIMYKIFRIIVGLLFSMHGMQKLGWLGGAPMAGFMAFVGVVEFLVGLGILVGLFVRLAAIGGFIVMAGAQVTTHLPNGVLPLFNGGEPSMLFLVAFLVIFAMGAGKFSLNHAFFRREML